jgi:hypothetical protein
MDAATALLLLLPPMLLLLRVSQHACTKLAASELRASALEGSDSNIQAIALQRMGRGVSVKTACARETTLYHCEPSRADANPAAAAAAADDGTESAAARPEASPTNHENIWGEAAAAAPRACKMRGMPPMREGVKAVHRAHVKKLSGLGLSFGMGTWRWN